MGFTVDPALLESAAATPVRAADVLSGAPAAGASAEHDASLMHYQPAVGMAEAVAQKAKASLGLSHDALTGLARGLRAAAANYRAADKLGSAAGAAGAAGSAAAATAGRAAERAKKK